jgi:hypothetical protein
VYLSKVDSVSHQTLVREVPQRLAALLSLPPGRLKIKQELKDHSGQIDLIICANDHLFVVECKGTGQAASVAMAARQVQHFAYGLKKSAVPLVVVPYMGEAGAQLCLEEGVSWFDLSGNAQLTAPGVRIHIEGKPNLYKRAGRPRSLFAPKSARITRWLLMEHQRSFTQRELAKVSGLDEGFTSRIIRGLEDQELVQRTADGKIRTSNYDTLLHAWREAYDFSKHQIVRGHVAARSSDDVLKRLAGKLPDERIDYAATGLAGAWLCSGFAGFRLVVLYVSDLPDQAARRRLNFHEIENGENVWLVRPDDDGVFQGAKKRHDIACVHPVQVYLDLKNHPERAANAADELRRQLLMPPPATADG